MILVGFSLPFYNERKKNGKKENFTKNIKAKSRLTI